MSTREWDQRVFVDTSAYYAAVDRRDNSHAAVAATMPALLAEGRQFTTTNAVLFELHGLLLNRIGRRVALETLNDLRASQTVVRVRDGDETRAEQILTQYDDRLCPEMRIFPQSGLVAQKTLQSLTTTRTSGLPLSSTPTSSDSTSFKSTPSRSNGASKRRTTISKFLSAISGLNPCAATPSAEHREVHPFLIWFTCRLSTMFISSALLAAIARTFAGFYAATALGRAT